MSQFHTSYYARLYMQPCNTSKFHSTDITVETQQIRWGKLHRLPLSPENNNTENSTSTKQLSKSSKQNKTLVPTL